ncbi:hypothetical protein HRF87_25905 [Bacillus sp. CRN 9]|nr:hypothetical protein [Bacillus sp. CRN 9]
MNDINIKLQLTIHNDMNVIVEYYKQHDFHKIKEKLKKVDSMGKYLQLNDSDSK